MNIYAISDLHLSGEPPTKPMEKFGDHWLGHKEKIKDNWLNTVQEDDYVIIAGDISWAMNLQEAAVDLDWIASLPGHKILLRGNHDYWWSSLSKLRKAYPSFTFLQNDSIVLELPSAGSNEDESAPSTRIAICGTRGWLLPSSEKFTEEDNKIYLREGIRMELGLQQAAKAEPNQLVLAMHYPPLFAAEETTVFTQLLEKYHVQQCVYGHIHGENHVTTFEGQRNGVTYKLVSCDTQGFQLYKLI